MHEKKNIRRIKEKIIKTSTLKNKLDRIFSKYIRLRDRIGKTDCIKCISCGKLVHWQESDCGHYINRAKMNLRYNEKNCHAQCRKCNRFEEGNMSGYSLGLIRKYGANIIEILESSKNQHHKYTRFDYEALIEHYTREVERLKEE